MQGSTNFKKTTSHLDILGATRATESKFHNEESQILGATWQNAIDPANWRPRFMHPWFKLHIVQFYTLTIYKRSFFESLADMDISSSTEKSKCLFWHSEYFIICKQLMKVSPHCIYIKFANTSDKSSVIMRRTWFPLLHCKQKFIYSHMISCYLWNFWN